MPAPANSLASLLSRVSLDDHDEILKGADAALKQAKSDTTAQLYKAVALLKLERYEEAVALFEGAGNPLKERAWLEYAYALYRSAQPEKAVQVAEEHSEGRGMLHLLAQASYRTEHFEKAATAYRQLSHESPEAEEEEYDLKINSGAVDAQLVWSGAGHLARGGKAGREALEFFETAYNAACGCIARGELAQAEIYLRRAKDLCNALPDLSEAEKKAEILPITVQQVYVLIKLGRLDEAEEVATDEAFAEIKELSTRRIAEINSVASMQEHSNPILTHRIFHSAPEPPKTDQMFTFQNDIIRNNEHVLDLMCRKYTGVARSTTKYIGKHASPTTSRAANTAAVLNAAAHVHDATGKAALKALLPLFDKHPNDVGLLLTIVHLYILTNNYTAATHFLETFFKRLEQSKSSADLDVRYAPGLVATLVTLYAIQRRNSQSKDELAKAATYWRHKSKTVPKGLLAAAGMALLESRNPQDLEQAGELFSSLHAQDSTDKAAKAGLAAAYAISDPSKLTSDLMEPLEPIPRLIAGIDAAKLEDAGVAIPTALLGSGLAQTKKRAAEEGSGDSKPKKVRKSRMPKDFDPNKKMDLERWLPMRDRSYYRPKGKKGKKRAEGLTQGGVVVEEKAAEQKAPAGGSGGAQKKKKGKGKR